MKLWEGRGVRATSALLTRCTTLRLRCRGEPGGYGGPPGPYGPPHIGYGQGSPGPYGDGPPPPDDYMKRRMYNKQYGYDPSKSSRRRRAFVEGALSQAHNTVWVHVGRSTCKLRHC